MNEREGMSECKSDVEKKEKGRVNEEESGSRERVKRNEKKRKNKGI
jgi:hypothetical protein